MTSCPLPSGFIDKFNCAIDSTFDIFGVTCTIVYIDTVEEISNTYDNIPDSRSINNHRRRPPREYKREEIVVREVEQTEDVVMKVYWDAKNWTQLGGNIVIPDNGIQTIFYATDLEKIQKAEKLIVHKDIESLQKNTFKKFGRPFPVSLKQKRYFSCFWVA